MVHHAERKPFVLDLSTFSVVGIGRVVPELEATSVRVRRRAGGIPTNGDREVLNFLDWTRRLVEAEYRDRAARAER